MARPRTRLAVPVPWLADGGIPPTRDAQSRPLLRLQTLGACVVQCGELRIGPSAGVLFAILVRLTHAAGMQVSRDQLVHLIWGGPDSARRRARLRQALYKLRSIGVRVVLEGGLVRLDPAQIARTFASDRSASHFERDVTRGHEPFGPFLLGYAAPTTAFDEWIETERENIHAEVRRVLVEQLRARRERADWTGAEALARWLLQFDPLHEDATLTLAECTMMAGAKLEAIAILDRYLGEIGGGAGDVRLPAEKLRRRFVEATQGPLSFAPTERHFVGREQELADLTLAMRRARWRDGSAVLFFGASGIGKSRFAHEVIKVATIEGVRALHACCRESDGTRTLALFHDMLPELLVIPGALGCTPESMATLHRLVRPPRRSAGESARVGAMDAASPAVVFADTDQSHNADSTTAAECLPSELDGGVVTEQAGEVPSSVDAESDLMLPPLAGTHDGSETGSHRESFPMAGSIRRAFLDLMAAISDERPVLLVIDDAHWMDLSSWDVLADVIERISALRLVVLLMSREPHARPMRPEGVPAALRVRPMPPLSAESSAQLTRLIGNDLSAPVSDTLCHWFVEASEGSPLFLRSLVQYWIETGEAGGVPPTLVQVIEQRLTKLSSEALLVLQTAALLGEEATVERIEAVLGLSVHRVLSCVEELERTGTLAPSERRYVAAHQLVATHAKRRLSFPMAAALHKRSGEVLSAESCPTNQIAHLIRIGEHFRASGNPSTFISFVDGALEKIVESGNPNAAHKLVGAALSLSPNRREALKFTRAISRLHLEAGEYAKCLGGYSGGVDLPEASARLTEKRADELLSQLDSAFRADPVVDRGQLLRVAVQLCERESLARPARLRAAEIGLGIAANMCDRDAADRCYLGCHIDENDLSDNVADMRVALMYHTIFGDLNISYRIAQDLIRWSTLDLQSTNRFNDLARAGYALRFSGSIEEVVSALKLAFDTAQSLSLPRLAQFPAWQLASVYLDAGLLREALKWNHTLYELFESDGDPISSNYIRGHRCRVAVTQSDSDSALRLLRECEVQLPKLPTPVTSAFLTALRLGVWLLDPSWIPTTDMLLAAEAQHSVVAKFGTNDFFSSNLARALLRAGQHQRARTLIERYLSCQRRESLPPSRELASVLATLCGD